MTDADTQKDTKIVDPKSNDTNANEDSAKVQAEQVQNDHFPIHTVIPCIWVLPFFSLFFLF